MPFDIDEYLRRNKINLINPNSDAGQLQTYPQVSPISFNGNAFNDDSELSSEASSLVQSPIPDNSTPQPDTSNLSGSQASAQGVLTNPQQNGTTPSQNPIPPSTDIPAQNSQSNSLPKALYQPGPKTLAYQEDIGNEPLKSDYHPGFGKKLLSILGGAATGYLGGGLQGGLDISDRIKNSQYYHDLGDYQNKLGREGRESSVESANDVSARKYYDDAAKINKNTEAANQERSHAEYYNRGGTPNYVTTLPEAIKFNESKHTSARLTPVTITLKDGTITHGSQNPGTGEITGLDGQPIDRSTLKDLVPYSKPGSSSNPLAQQTEYQTILADPNIPENDPKKLAAKTLVKTGNSEDKSAFGQLTHAYNIIQNPDKHTPAEISAAHDLVKNQQNKGLMVNFAGERLSDEKLKTQELLASHHAKVIDTTLKPYEELDQQFAKIQGALTHPTTANMGLLAPLLVAALGPGKNLRITNYEAGLPHNPTLWNNIKKKLAIFSNDPSKAQWTPEEVVAVTKAVKAAQNQNNKILSVGNAARAKLSTQIGSGATPAELMGTSNELLKSIQDVNSSNSGSIKKYKNTKGEVSNVHPSRLQEYLKDNPGAQEVK